MTKQSKKVLAQAKRRLQAGVTRRLQVECESTHELVRSKLAYIICALVPIAETSIIFTSALLGLLINHLVKKYEFKLSEEDQRTYCWSNVCIEYSKDIFNAFATAIIVTLDDNPSYFSNEFLDEYNFILTRFEEFVENF